MARASTRESEAKGVLAHRLDGVKYLWSPATDPETEGTSLIVEATRTFVVRCGTASLRRVAIGWSSL